MKKEKYLLKKQKKEKERLLRARQKKIKRIIRLSLPLLLIIGAISWGLISYLSREPQENHPGTPKMEISPKEYDAGTVSMAEGLVERTFEIKNTGEGDLKIDKIWTSCMCTTARLKVGEKTSPKFGMHNNPYWSGKIAPGKTGYLEVTFDPAYHGPQGVGDVVRAVYISSSDPQNKKVEVRLLAKVIP